MMRNRVFSRGSVKFHVPLQFEPGTHYAFSNFGYCLLGRIVEGVTGQSYERFVQSAILKPSGAHGMVLARNTLAERQPQEVVYMGGRWPYSIDVHRMDAHGGWLASPSDLLRILVRVDRFDTVPDLLSDGILRQMYTATSASNGGYAKGWSVNSVPNYWHNGAVPGTLALLVRTQDGFGWAAMTNARPPNDRFAKHLDRLMWDIRGAIQQWPSHNLF